MNPIDFIEPWYYSTAYYILFLLLSWMTVLYYIGSNNQKILYSEGTPMQGAALLLTLVLIFFLGLRPISGYFGDMNMYTHSYVNVVSGYVSIDFHTEWLWENFTAFCKKSGLNANEYFLTVAFFYFMGMFVCSLMLMRKNLWLAVLFFFTSFSCYSFSTNGIRNGMACSIELIAICLLAEGGIKRPLSFVLMFLALGIHRSTMLPSAMAIGSAFVIKDTKTAIRFWIASIAISLVAGPIVEGFFASLGFDDRMSDYASVGQSEQSMSQFSKAGFRWDFLIYSVFPVIMTWYVTRVRKFNDRVFNVFANTYIFCNAFWIMVIRAEYSNRFAYLSWFLYPIVIAYPLLRLDIWPKTQGRKCAVIMAGHYAFSFLMSFVV